MGRDRSLVLGLSAGGVVGGHALAYILAYPVASARATHLAGTGHGGFESLALASCLAAGLAFVAICLRAVRREGGAPGVRTLLGLQVGLFLALELSERAFDLGAAAADPAVLLGIPLQVALAATLAWLARGAVTVAHALVRSAPPRAPRSVAKGMPVRTADPEPPDLAALRPRRAPPILPVG
jgi:hypothetical protein